MLDDAEARDRADPLRHLRAAFAIEDDGPIYADGNSLGRLTFASRDALAHAVEGEWGNRLIGAWDEWFDLPTKVGDLIGTSMLGARPGETVVADSTTVNLFKLAGAAMKASAPERMTIVTDRANFPTDRYVLAATGGEIAYVGDDPTADDVERVLRAHEGRVALVSLSLVAYRTGALLDLGAITRAAHDAGALVLWDLSHAVGAVELDLAAHRVDLAVGCTYKYLNGGPGSPAFLYVREDLHERLEQPIPGWFGTANPFEMGPTHVPARGIRRFTSGTPPVLALRSVEAAVQTLADAGVAALAAKGRLLTEFVIECATELLEPLGFRVVTPRDPARRGAHVALQHPDAWRVCRALIERAAVTVDFREPDIVRFGFAPAYTRFVDVQLAMTRTEQAVREGLHLEMSAARSRIT